MLLEVERMDAASSRIQENDFDTVERGSDGKLMVHNERYKTRIRATGTVCFVFRLASLLVSAYVI